MDGGRVALHRLTFVEDGDHVVVGRPDIESYAVFPTDGAELLRQLWNGATVTEAVAWYEATYRETPDVADFLDTLEDLGFLRHPDPDGSPGSGRSAQVGLRRLGRAVFGPAAWVLYGALAVAATVALLAIPAVRPTPTRIFFTHSLVVVQFALIAAELPLVFLHELAHVLAGRRIGLRSSLSIGRRLHFVVFQTTMTSLFSVPPRRRYLPLLAGMVADAVVVSVLVLAAAADRLTDGSLSVAGRLAVALAYLTVLRVAWQFLVVVETDMQHVLATALRCAGLGRTTAGYLWGWARRLARRTRAGEGADVAADTYYSPRELAVLRWFAPLTLVGVVALLGLAAVTVVPVLAGLVDRIGDGFAGGAGHAGFWDSFVALLLLLAQFGVLGGLLVRGVVSGVRRHRSEKEQRSAAL